MRIVVFCHSLLSDWNHGNAQEETGDRPFTRRDDLTAPGWPKMAFLEHAFAGDPTNWWVPNRSAVEAMLRSSGLEVVARPGHEIYLCRPAPDGHCAAQPHVEAVWGSGA